MNCEWLMNAREFYGDVSPTLLQEYWKQVASHFIRYTNGYAGMAVLEVYWA